MSVTISGARVLTDSGLVDGLDVRIENGRIAAVLPVDAPASDGARYDAAGLTLLPGFVDVQNNGGGGVLFNDDPSVDVIAAIAQAHRRFGTTGFLPTLISDDLDVVRRAVAAVDEAIDRGVPGVLGIHIEGPFLNADRKGIHDRSKLRTLDEEGFAVITGLKRGRTLVTLAPERTTPAMLRRLAATGVVVAAGHTNGDYGEIREALDNGLTGFTHLFNAMSQLTAREPGAVGAALEDVHSWCGLIVDGRHVDPVVMRLALRCRPRNRFILVTDAMPSVGMTDKRFMLQGQEVRVVDGVCMNADGTLAGADLDMATAVRNAVTMLDLPLAEAARMASAYPAAFLRLDGELGRIAPGQRADLVLVDDALEVVETWIAGERG